jgi:plasmid maintenance system antidote protein VapI
VARKKKDPPSILQQPIKDRIKALKLTSYATAKMSGVAATVIQRFVNGERDLTLGTAEKLCRALDLILVTRPDSTLDIELVRQRTERAG